MTTITFNKLTDNEKKICLNTLTDEQRVQKKVLEMQTDERR